MKRTLAKYRESAFHAFIKKHEKYAPVLFFIGGFIFDSLTLGRIDRTYDLLVLCFHMTSLSITLYLYNLVDDGKWANTLIYRYQDYFPLAIQFFFGGLSSAYVIYFFRSVSFSKTAYFFIILLALLFANEFLKKRISNKYLQFSVYYFISFTFFTFMIPVFIKEMNIGIFLISGMISLSTTLFLIIFIYRKSPSTRREIHLGKMIGIVLSIYFLINTFYFFKLIPPVPLALLNGVVAHDIKKEDGKYIVTYEKDEWYKFWRKYRSEFILQEDSNVFVFSSIFAPTDLEKSIFHRWNYYNASAGEWEVADNIGFSITGGRDGGYRGYTFKNNVKEGLWKVEVLTEEGLVLGVITFEIVIDPDLEPQGIVKKRF